MSGWSPHLRRYLPLRGGGELRTLRDAGNYIAGSPKRRHDAPAWRAAIEALMLVAEHSGPTMLARIGMMKALYRHHKPVSARRGKKAKKYKVIGQVAVI